MTRRQNGLVPLLATLLALALGLAVLPAPALGAAVGAAVGVAGDDGLWQLEAQGWPVPDLPEVASWVLVDVTSGQLLGGRHELDPRPPASTTKLLTALAVARRIQPDEVATISALAASQTGASTGLRAGDRVRVDDLLALLLLRSGNDAAVALAEHTAGSVAAFSRLMREEAANLGLDRYVLEEPHGLDDRNLLSARQLAVIGRAVLAHDQLRPLVGAPTWRLTTGRVVTNRNHLLGAYPGATGLKTGMTTAAGWSLVASARRGPRHLVAVVLGAGDDESRFAAAASLLDHGFEAFEPPAALPDLRLRGAGTWLTVEAPGGAPLLPARATPVLEPALPVEVVDPLVSWQWAATGAVGPSTGRWSQQAVLRPGTGEVRFAPVQSRVARDGDGSGQLGAWLSGRVQAAFRAATVAGLWDD